MLTKIVIKGASILLLLCLWMPHPFAAQVSTQPVITDQIFVSEDGEAPLLVEHHRGRLFESVDASATIYIKIDGAKRAHDLSGQRALIQWSEDSDIEVAPTIEYKKVYDATGKNSLGFTYLLAIKPEPIYIADYTYTIKGEAMVGTRIHSSLKSQPFSITIKGSASELLPNPVQYDPVEPIFTVSGPNENIYMLFEDKASFAFSSRDQGAINLSFTTATNDILTATYPLAKLRFVGWSHGPIFNQRGILHIYADKGSFLYRETENGLLAVDAQYNIDDAAFVLETRNLGRYVLSNVLLDPPIAHNLKSNPPTGAIIAP